MNYKSLRKSVAEECASMSFSGSAEDIKAKGILAACILFKKVYTLSLTDQTYDGLYKQLISNYSHMAELAAKDSNSKFGCFENIKAAIRKNRISSFIEMGKAQIDEIYQIYTDSQLIKTFNTETFSGLMYGIGSLSYPKLKRLMRAHYNVIAPIVRYYKNGYGILNSDVHVADRNLANAGKSIILSINGVNSIQILADIKSDKFNIGDYVYSATLDKEGYIIITMK